jgi:spore germination protein YaaH
MKKITLLLVITILLMGMIVINKNKTINKQRGSISQTPTKTQSQTSKKTLVTKRQKSIFVPSWQVGEDKELQLEDYSRLLYFGLTPSSAGISKDDAYNKLKYLDTIQIDKILVIKMINDNINELVLNNVDIQKKVIDETINIAKEYKFTEIALDIELFSLFQDEKKTQINSFVNKFYTSVKDDNLRLSIILYGDVVYRKKAFDLQFIANNTDEIFIMAYDFHKSKGGEPGPNFPFLGKEKYGYDFQQMITDYLQISAPEKITVIFGMYGYEWTVDEKKRPIRQAEALTYNQIKKQFLNKCEWQDCIVKRDDLAKETEINYITSEIVDNIGRINYHVIWFEDQESVSIKTKYLEEQGIGSVAFWAYGYY